MTNYVYQSELVRIWDRSGERNLILGPKFDYRQGSMLLRDPNFLNLEFTRNLTYCASLPTEIRRGLILGLGAGCVPKALHKIFGPQLEIFCVDNNQEIIRAAEAFFEVKVDDYKIYEYNAEHFVALEIGKFDFICVDIWDDKSIPDFILSKGFWEEIRLRLNKNFSVCINGPREKFKDLLDIFLSTFGTCFSLKAQNTCLLSTNSDDFHIDRERQKALSDVGVECNLMKANMVRHISIPIDSGGHT